MAVVYSSLSVIPVVACILLSVSGSFSGLTSDLLTCLVPCLLFFWMHLLLTAIPEGTVGLMNRSASVGPCYDPSCSDTGGL